MTKTGVVISHQGVKIVVRANNETLPYSIKRNSDFVVGDIVNIDESRPKRLERRNVLQRETPYGLQSIAANLDAVGIVIAKMPPVPSLFIDQVVMAALSQNIRPFIVINKVDIKGTKEALNYLVHTFGSSLPIIWVSASTSEGLDELKRFVRTSGRCILVGVSGVGKSSLLNAMLGELIQKTNSIVDKDRHGQHTTSQSTLFSLESGGELIDSPGVRDFSPPNLEPGEVAHLFVSFEKIPDKACRFRNCLHVSEPGCKVRTAVSDGLIEKERYEAYLELLTNSQQSLLQRR